MLRVKATFFRFSTDFATFRRLRMNFNAHFLVWAVKVSPKSGLIEKEKTVIFKRNIANFKLVRDMYLEKTYCVSLHRLLLKILL